MQAKPLFQIKNVNQKCFSHSTVWTRATLIHEHASMTRVCRRKTTIHLHAILWVPWKAKFMRLPTGDNYLFSFLSFPYSQLIKTLITYSMRIKFKPEEEKCTYAEVTARKQWLELDCRWWHLCQERMWKNSMVITTPGSIILISCHFYIGLNVSCLWDYGGKSRCWVL